MKIYFYLLVVVLFPSILSAQTPVPHGKPPLLDGHIDKTEWADAAVIPLEDFARAYVKESDGFVWLGVELLKAKNGTVDLYLSAEDGTIYDLHASAKLGERKLHGALWPDKWTWWNNEGWSANISRVDSWEKRTFLDQPAREFQISRAKFPGKRWKLMFEIMTSAEPEWQMTRFPKNTANTGAKGWYEILFHAE